MLETMNLDTEGFEEIFRKARSQISEIYPVWNNYNYHDPGITILELMAFLKEAQHFHLDHISEESFEGYLRLWGIERKKAQGASIVGHILGDMQVKIGQRFYKNHLPFETDASFTALEKILKGVLTVKGSLETKRPIYPFGEKPKVGDSCYILLNEALSPNKDYHLTLAFDKGAVERNAIEDFGEFSPLVRLAFSYFDGKEERAIGLVDTSAGFLQDATLTLRLESYLSAMDFGATKDYAIKITLVEGQYDSPPAITELGFSQCKLSQKETLASFFPVEDLEKYSHYRKKMDYYREEDGQYSLADKENASHVSLYDDKFENKKILALGTGFPHQSYELHRGLVLGASLKVLVKDVLSDGYILFEEVDDFGASGPLSYHYKILEEEGKILFGDGRHGFPPETEIRIVSLALALGSEGNISLDSLLHSKEQNTKPIKVESLSSLGRKRESLGDALGRMDEEKYTRLVTARDYETVIGKTPGLKIAECRVLEDYGDENAVSVVVRPGDGPLYLSKAYKENILQHCEDKRLLGTKLKLLSPSYTEIDVYAEIHMKAEYRQGKEGIEKAIRSYFAELDSFGASIEYSDLYRRIETLEAVSQIKTMHIGARGDGIMRKRNGDVISPKTSVTILKEISLHIVS